MRGHAGAADRGDERGRDPQRDPRLRLPGICFLKGYPNEHFDLSFFLPGNNPFLKFKIDNQLKPAVKWIR